MATRGGGREKRGGGHGGRQFRDDRDDRTRWRGRGRERGRGFQGEQRGGRDRGRGGRTGGDAHRAPRGNLEESGDNRFTGGILEGSGTMTT